MEEYSLPRFIERINLFIEEEEFAFALKVLLRELEEKQSLSLLEKVKNTCAEFEKLGKIEKKLNYVSFYPHKNQFKKKLIVFLEDFEREFALRDETFRIKKKESLTLPFVVKKASLFFLFSGLFFLSYLLFDSKSPNANVFDFLSSGKNQSEAGIEEYDSTKLQLGIGFLDSGINVDYITGRRPDLVPVIGKIINTIDLTGEGIQDENGHGTSVYISGLDSEIEILNQIAFLAKKDTSQRKFLEYLLKEGISNMHTLNIKIIDKWGETDAFKILKGIQEAAKYKVRNVNLSAGAFIPIKEKNTFCKAIQKYCEKGMMIVVTRGDRISVIENDIEKVLFPQICDCDCIFLPQGRPHGYSSRNPQEILSLPAPRAEYGLYLNDYKTWQVRRKIIDKRDKKNYKTVFIGGKEWLAENLNFESYESDCYKNDTSFCNKYGRLYPYISAQKACSGLGKGWRLPHPQEWKEVEFIFGNSKIAYSALIKGGNSKLDIKFSGKSVFGKFYQINEGAYFWSSNGSSFEFIKPLGLQTLNYLPLDSNEGKLSCRCVRTHDSTMFDYSRALSLEPSILKNSIIKRYTFEELNENFIRFKSLKDSH